MPRENKSRYAILGLLNKNSMSGYDIKTIFNRFSSFHWSESNAQIYPMLKTLEGEGLVQSHIDPESGKRKRRLYAITGAGVNVLNDWLVAPCEEPKYREELLLKLSNAQDVNASIMIEQIENYVFEIEVKRRLLQKQLEHIDVDHKGRADQAVLRLTYEHAEYVLNAKHAWAKHALAYLQAI